MWCDACNVCHQLPLPCTKIDCARCAVEVRRRRGARLVRRMGGQGIGVWVLTFPDSWHPWLTIECLRVIEKRLVRLVQDWYRARDACEVGLRSYLHPRGDRCDACGAADGGWEGGTCTECGEPPSWRPHFNFLVPLEGITQAGAIRRIRPWNTTEELYDFRKLLGDELREIAGKLGLPDAIAPNFFYEYATAEAKVKQVCGYFARPFPEWAGTMYAFGHGRDWGLLAFRNDRPGLDFWRTAIRGPEDDDDKPQIRCSRCKGGLLITGIMSIESRLYAELLSRQGTIPFPDTG